MHDPNGGNAHFDAMSPCSVRWSFHKPGSNEQLQQGGEKDTNADSSYIYVIPKGDSELRYMSVTDALESFGAYPSGTLWGFTTLVDSRKQVMLRPTETLYVTPQPVAIVYATVQNAGYGIGLRAASDPEKKTDLLRPIMVVHNGDTRATLAPRQNSQLVRFVNTRKSASGLMSACTCGELPPHKCRSVWPAWDAEHLCTVMLAVAAVSYLLAGGG